MSDTRVMLECQRLVDEALYFAAECLTEDGSFAPFAVTLDPLGETEGVFPQGMGMGGGDSRSDFEALVEALREEAGEGDHLAVAVAVNSWVRAEAEARQRDAIAILVDHRDGYALESYHYYDLEERRGDLPESFHLELLDAESLESDSLIFASA